MSGESLSKNDIQRLTQISTSRIFWSNKLVALAEKTTDKIAVTNFSYKNKVFSLYGIIAVSKDAKEFDIIIKDFVQKIRDDRQISDDFPEIKFVSSRKDTEKDIEIIRFQIDCYSKTYGVKAGGK